MILHSGIWTGDTAAAVVVVDVVVALGVALLDGLVVVAPACCCLSSCKTQTVVGVVVAGRTDVADVGHLCVRSTPGLVACCQDGRPIHSLGIGAQGELQHSSWTSLSHTHTHTRTLSHSHTHSLYLSHSHTHVLSLTHTLAHSFSLSDLYLVLAFRCLLFLAQQFTGGYILQKEREVFELLKFCLHFLSHSLKLELIS